MENDDDNTLKINDDPDNNFDIFKPDYKDQSFEKSAKFKNWKKSMIDKHGKKGRFFTCFNDNIVFYSLDSEENKIGECSFCPKCHSEICFFCKKSFIMENRENCCFRQILHCMHKNGIKFLNSKKEELEKEEDYDSKAFYFFLIPCVNFILLSNFCYNIFFYKLIYSHDSGNRYIDTLRENGSEFLLILNVIMNTLTFCLLLIPFLIHSIAISFISLILSICPKSPYTYFIGCIHVEWHYLYTNTCEIILCC